MTRVTTSKTDCIDALLEAADRLGESPTKAQYESLGLTPASGTIMRRFGGWNEAKEAAGLEIYDQRQAGGRPVEPKPPDVDLPDDLEWTELTGQQRWYYKNKAERIARKDRRRRALRRWIHDLKRNELECVRCGEGRPACLDFHHPGEKNLGVARMVARGYSKKNLREEIQDCVVLCANCHRAHHYREPTPDSQIDSV